MDSSQVQGIFVDIWGMSCLEQMKPRSVWMAPIGTIDHLFFLGLTRLQLSLLVGSGWWSKSSNFQPMCHEIACRCATEIWKHGGWKILDTSGFCGSVSRAVPYKLALPVEERDTIVFFLLKSELQNWGESPGRGIARGEDQGEDVSVIAEQQISG